MKKQQSIEGSLASVPGKIALAFLGVGIALGMMELLLRTFPNWVPSEVRVNPPARRIKAFVDETYDLKLSDGDLFHWMQGAIAPLPPEADKVVAHIHMITDAYGFRNSVPEDATYGIVALGDSYTRASGVATPWPQKLAMEIGINVLNLGDVGFGQQDELAVFQQYGLKKQPQWVILAYFEGNDLNDAAAYEQANPFILTRFVKHMLEGTIESWSEVNSGSAHTTVAPSYRYPITVMINDTNMEMAFFSSYFSWLSISGEVIGSSENFRFVRETILKMRDLSEAGDSHFLLVYIPSKEHIYLPYLKDGETLANVFSDVRGLALDESGFLQFTNNTATPELVSQHMDDQAILLADFAAEHKILYLDLTPTFQEEASTGAELYYPFDTHWNQSGHNLAAETINEYIKEILPTAASEIPGH